MTTTWHDLRDLADKLDAVARNHAGFSMVREITRKCDSHIRVLARVHETNATLAVNNTELLRAVRDVLRALHANALEEIELVLVRALDRIAEEAVVWGADERHDFRTDAAAAAALELIERELERVVATLLRKVGGI